MYGRGAEAGGQRGGGKIDIEEKCPVCGSALSAALRHCPTCRYDAGAPNVRRCKAAENVKALNERCAVVRGQAATAGHGPEFDALREALLRDSGVVITMSATVARKLMDDPKALYANYEALVGAGARKPAIEAADRQRCAVGGALFGSYADSIQYGALSLTGAGLPTYGSVYCRLRSVAIDKRTTFLETNSYRFVEKYNIAGTSIPLGLMASWEQRHVLALTKIGDQVRPGQSLDDWQAILIRSDGKSRNNDECVEAHIFEGFDRNAIESVEAVPEKKVTREERLDLRIVVSMFNQVGARK